MASADVQILGTGSKAAPLDYNLPAGAELLLKAVRADFDGSGAAGSFYPALEIVSDAGHSVGVYPADVAVAAGGSASVSFAPFLRNAGAAATATTFAASGMSQLPSLITVPAASSVTLPFDSWGSQDGYFTFTFAAGEAVAMTTTTVGVVRTHYWDSQVWLRRADFSTPDPALVYAYIHATASGLRSFSASTGRRESGGEIVASSWGVDTSGFADQTYSIIAYNNDPVNDYVAVGARVTAYEWPVAY